MTMYTTGSTTGWRVFVGEAVTGLTSVSSVVMYAYNGAYISTPAVLTLSNITTFNCNIGSPFDIKAKLICKTAEHGYGVGDEVELYLYHPGAYYGGNVFARNNSTDGAWKKAGIAMSGNLHVVYDAVATNYSRTLTPANWNAQVFCTRKF